MGTARIYALGLVCLVQIADGETPVITRQPQGVEVYAGNNAVFTVEADGFGLPLTYQWMFDGVPIPGATDTFVSIPEVRDKETGVYTVEISGAADSVTSEPAQLTISGLRPTIVDTNFASGLEAPGLGLPRNWTWTDTMLLVFPDGRAWIAGYYGSVTEPYPRLVAADADGQPTPTFDGFAPYGEGGRVLAMVRAFDDKVYMAGLSEGQSPVPYFVVRLNANGQLDTAFAPITLAERWDFMTPHQTGLVIGIEAKLTRYKGDGTPDTGFLIADPDTPYISATVDHDGNLFALVEYPGELHQLGLDGALVARKESVYGEKDSLFTGLDGRLYFEDDWLDQWLAPSMNRHDTRYIRIRQITQNSSEGTKELVEIIWRHSWVVGFTYGENNPSGRPEEYGIPLNVFARPAQSVFSSTVDTDGNLFVSVIDAHGYALKKKPFDQTLPQFSGFDGHYSAGSGPDHFNGLPATQLHPSGDFLYVAGDFSSFDGHPSSRLARLFLEPPDPPDIPTKTKPRLMVYRPKGREFPQDSLFEIEVVVMGSPPFTALLGKPELFPIVGGGEILSDSHARDGAFRFRFKPPPKGYSVVSSVGPWRPYIEIFDRFGSTVHLSETYGSINWTPSPPKIAKVKRSIHLSGRIRLEADVYGSKPLSISWMRDGELIPSASGDVLLIESRPENSGHYQCVITNAQGSTQSENLSVTIGSAGAGWPRMTNVSLRAMSRSGEEAIIMGVVADGPRTLVARAVGPSLVPLGVVDPLPDPLIKVFTADSALLGWADSLMAKSYTQNLGAFPLIDGSPEASLLVNLMPNRPKTLQTVDVADRPGNVLVEAYVQEDNGGRIRNISERAWIKGREAVAIAGFVLSDADDFDILIRAAGPALGEYGVAAFCPDPSIDLYRLGETEPLATNVNWIDGFNPNDMAATFTRAGAFAFGPASPDAALRVTLGPGVYTAVARCAEGSEGIVLIEVYDLTEEIP